MEEQIANSAAQPSAARLPSLLHGVATLLCGALLVASPWCFASWEMWWFWPMTVLVFAAAAFSGAGAAVEALLGVRVRPGLPRRAIVALLLFLPFFGYAAWRTARPSGPDSPLVAMEAERSLLLFFTPWLLALSIGVSTGPRSRAALLRAMLASAFVLCVYALVNHFVTNDMMILWVKGYDFHYSGRASAPFFCPNNFVDFAAFFCFVALAALLAPGTRVRGAILWIVLCAVFFAAEFFSISRGGLVATVVAVAAGVVPFGFRGRRLWVRAIFAVVAVLAVVGGACAVRYTDNPVMKRVGGHAVWTLWRDTPLEKQVLQDQQFRDRVERTFMFQFDRGQYIGAALRAWRSSPRIGIGPGQHTHRWAQFEPTSDGIRPGPGGEPALKKPRFAHYGKHLYEVHSDWTQLLEEYGTVGLALLLPPLLFLVVALSFSHRAAIRKGDGAPLDRGLPLAAWMALVMVGVHCIIDFPMQIPALVWTLAAISAIGLLAGSEGRVRQ